MNSRMELRKKNNRSIWYIVIGCVVLVVLAAFFIISNNNRKAAESKAAKFATTHFNKNVSIYGVKVSNLTVAAATKKINAKAKNVATLTNGKVTTSRDSSVKTISKSQVQTYFKKQHTETPNSNKYSYANTDLADGVKKLKKIAKTVVTYDANGTKFKLSAKTLVTKATYKNGKVTFNDTTKLTNKLNEMDKQVKTLHKSYKFTVPSGSSVNGKTITVTNKTYGWGIWTAKAANYVKQAFLSGKNQTIDGANAIYGLGYTTYGLGYGKSNHGIGDNYVVVSIKKQELWVVKNGKVAVHLTDVVTGTLTGTSDNKTPTGVWYIHYKQRNTTLTGQNDDGSDYSSKVSYWMPFTLSGCGLHDASWRTDWSKTAYLKGGSHGCVNIRPSEIKEVWNAVIQHEAVIVYN